MTGYDGILLIDKPTGITSSKAVTRVRSALGGVKVGHLGTLDPFASGLLPLCVGAGRKIAQFLNVADKSYQGTITLGVTSDTLDATGEISPAGAVPELGSEDLRRLEARFTGTLEQVPPAFSAIKKGGVPMYRLARSGVEVELEPREVTIYRLRLEARGRDTLEVDLDCSKGTYVRALARDIGKELGCGGLLASLRRTAFGPFRLDRATSLESVLDEETREEALGRALLCPAEALGHLPSIEVDRRTAEDLRRGRQGALLGLGRSPRGAEDRACIMCQGSLVAVVAPQDRGWRLSRVFD